MPIAQFAKLIPKSKPVWSQLLVAGLMLMLSSSCGGSPKADAESAKRPSGAQQGNSAVDVAIPGLILFKNSLNIQEQVSLFVKCLFALKLRGDCST